MRKYLSIVVHQNKNPTQATPAWVGHPLRSLGGSIAKR